MGEQCNDSAATCHPVTPGCSDQPLIPAGFLWGLGGLGRKGRDNGLGGREERQYTGAQRPPLAPGLSREGGREGWLTPAGQLPLTLGILSLGLISPLTLANGVSILNNSRDSARESLNFCLISITCVNSGKLGLSFPICKMGTIVMLC